jgi:pyruvate dehydrogenase E1 component beta subunit
MAKMTLAQAIREAIREEMRADERIVLIGEDIGIEGGFGGAFGVYLGLAEEFGHDRVIDTPISEKLIIGAAVGMAIAGLWPIADFQYSDFMFNAMDELVNEAPMFTYMSGGKVSVPLVVRAPIGASTRGAQHGHCPESYIYHCPGWKVACPSNAYDAKGLIKTAIRDPNPVFVFEHKLLYGSKGREKAGGFELETDVPEEEYTIPFGKAAIKREGKSVTVIATHLMIYKTMAIADKLSSDGIDIELIDPRTLVPLDKETIFASIAKTGRLIIVEEDNLTLGWGSEISAVVAEEAIFYLDAPIKRIAMPDVPLPFAPRLESFVVPSQDRIYSEIKHFMED